MLILVLLIIVSTPVLLQFNTPLKKANQFFYAHQMGLLAIHSLLYLGIYAIWPQLIGLIIRRSEFAPTNNQISLAIQSRVYVLAALVLFEFLNIWR